jgi:hypothetical protein
MRTKSGKKRKMRTAVKTVRENENREMYARRAWRFASPRGLLAPPIRVIVKFRRFLKLNAINASLLSLLQNSISFAKAPCFVRLKASKTLPLYVGS